SDSSLASGSRETLAMGFEHTFALQPCQPPVATLRRLVTTTFGPGGRTFFAVATSLATFGATLLPHSPVRGRTAEPLQSAGRGMGHHRHWLARRGTCR